MRKRLCVLAVFAIMGATMVFTAKADVVESAYNGPMGNPEEPALRPYKWMWRGLGAMFYQIGNHFRDGNAHTPFLGSVQTLRGVRVGTFELLESTFKGSVFAPPPPRGSFKKLLSVNTNIANNDVLSRTSDIAFSWFLYPAIVFVDEDPAYTDEEVRQRREEAEAIRAQREAAEASHDGSKAWQRAQIRYIGDRATYGQKK